MPEQSSILPKLLRTTVVWAVASLLCAMVVRAGDPIQFSNDKSKPRGVGTETRPVEADAFKTWNKVKGPATQLNPLAPFILPGRMDPKEEKRLKNIRDEKKNWMLLEPGELQKRDEKEDKEFAGKTVAIDDLDETEDGNYLFYNVTDQKSDKPVSNAQRSNPVAAEDEPKKDARSLSIFGPREGDKAGAHTASELNLKGLIDPAQLNADKFNKSEASLFQFFKDNAPTAADRDQQARRDNFRDFINGPQPGGRASGISDPINFRTDLTQERMNPNMPSRPAFDLPGVGRGSDSFSATPPLGGAFGPLRAPGLPETAILAPRQPMGGSYLPSPLLTPNEAAKTPRATMFNREGVRRPGT